MLTHEIHILIAEIQKHLEASVFVTLLQFCRLATFTLPKIKNSHVTWVIESDCRYFGEAKLLNAKKC